MIKFGTIVLFLVLLLAVQADKNKIVKLSVIDHPTSRSLEGTSIGSTLHLSQNSPQLPIRPPSTT